MSREVGRLLRWRHPAFLRRRLPYVWDVARSPVRSTWWKLRNLTFWLQVCRCVKLERAGVGALLA